MSPVTLKHLMKEDWNYGFSREQAAYPVPWLYEMGKVFPYVGRVDNVWGDRNLVCTCPPVTAFFDYGEGQDNEYAYAKEIEQEVINKEKTDQDK